MTEGPQKFFLTCPECNERVFVEIPEDPAARREQTALCSHGHSFTYDERTVLGPPEPAAAPNG
jgi:hypothetical protein